MLTPSSEIFTVSHRPTKLQGLTRHPTHMIMFAHIADKQVRSTLRVQSRAIFTETETTRMASALLTSKGRGTTAQIHGSPPALGVGRPGPLACYRTLLATSTWLRTYPELEGTSRPQGGGTSICIRLARSSASASVASRFASSCCNAPTILCCGPSSSNSLGGGRSKSRSSILVARENKTYK